VIIALVVTVMAACTWWALRYQQRVLRLLNARPSHVARTDSADGAPAHAAVARPLEPAQSPDGANTLVAVQQLARVDPHRPTSVLGWEAFSLVSTLVLEGTVLLACRRQLDEPFPRVVTLRPPSRPESGPSEEATIVLLIGEDERAGQAVALLDAWQQARVILRLRPTPIAGAIEVFDGRHSALRAALLAA
jgi:hypothetical protein